MVQLTPNALKVLSLRYLLRDPWGDLMETPEQLFRRVANYVALAELSWSDSTIEKVWQEKFYQVMSGLLFLPNSPTLMNAGTGKNQLSACFVLPVEDNLKGIFSTLKNAAMVQQSGGGTGFNFSRLRAEGDVISLSGGTASGPVSFMKIFDAATEQVKQGGKRRGANMGILNIDHPDIEKFITLKREKGLLRNFNISVGISDQFMDAVEADGHWSLTNPGNKKVVKTLPAKKLWDEIALSAWMSGDPGLIFLDTINKKNPTPGIGIIESTNPCGEVPLLPYESCNLGSVNLIRHIRERDGIIEIDWNQMEGTIETAVRFLDDVIEVNDYLLPEIKSMARGNRKIGLGIMGWAELLTLLEIPYESEKAIELAEKLMSFFARETKKVSAALANERGCFPNWENSIYYPEYPMRNATTVSIAPTGTISIIAGTSSSIEPLFALAFQRKHVLNDETLFSINEIFIHYLKKHHLFDEAIMKEVIQSGTAENISGLPKRVKNIFKTALHISPNWHLRHQVVFQSFTDNAVSKTINMPEEATVEDVKEVYFSAWKQQAKGVTVFRNNSTDKQVFYQGIRRGSSACKVCAEQESNG